MRRWQRLGLIFSPEQQRDWFVSHAALPYPDHVSGDWYHVYFSGRDSSGRARIGHFELEVSRSPMVGRVSDRPALDIGPLGTFDDNGVTSSWVVSSGGSKYLYYSGWTKGVSVPFYFYVGLATSDSAGGVFRRISSSPILERDTVDPYLTGSPCVHVEAGVWRMWYVSGSGWSLGEGYPMHRYHIKYAESDDGIHWTRTGLVCVDYASPDEYAIARPTVIREGGKYRMWFCCRGRSYRLGYAESWDGLHWERDDSAAGLDPSVDGWDSEMIAYPCVFHHDGAWYLLYNGNGYGRSGIGLAVWD